MEEEVSWKIEKVEKVPIRRREAGQFYEQILRDFVSKAFRFGLLTIKGKNLFTVVSGLKAARERLKLKGKIMISLRKGKGIYLTNLSIPEEEKT